VAQDARFKFLEKRGIDSYFHGNDIRSNEITVLSSKTMTEGIKLTIFTYKWGKRVKLVGKYLLERLIK
jgi:hypothetical protein